MDDNFFECFECSKVFAAAKRTEGCPSCGGMRGEWIAAERVEKGMKAGTYFNLGPDGKRAKDKRRR